MLPWNIKSAGKCVMIITHYTAGFPPIFLKDTTSMTFCLYLLMVNTSRSRPTLPGKSWDGGGRGGRVKDENVRVAPSEIEPMWGNNDLPNYSFINIGCDPSLEHSHQDSYMFLLRSKKN